MNINIGTDPQERLKTLLTLLDEQAPKISSELQNALLRDNSKLIAVEWETDLDKAKHVNNFHVFTEDKVYTQAGKNNMKINHSTEINMVSIGWRNPMSFSRKCACARQ